MKKGLVLGYAMTALVVAAVLCWPSGQPARVSDPQLPSVLDEMMRDSPAVPNLRAQVDRILLDEDVPAETPHEGSPSATPTTDEWNALPRLEGDVARMMMTRPAEASLRNLLRHTQLNPSDVPVEARAWQEASATLAPLHARIVELVTLEATTADAEMARIAASGLFAGAPMQSLVTDEGVEWSFPAEVLKRSGDVYGLHADKDKIGFAFALGQLPQTQDVVRLRESLTCEYASAVSDFFVSHGLMHRNGMLTFMESVFRSGRTTR